MDRQSGVPAQRRVWWLLVALGVIAVLGAAFQAAGSSVPTSVQVLVAVVVAASGVLVPEVLGRVRQQQQAAVRVLGHLRRPLGTSPIPFVREVADPEFIGASRSAFGSSPPYVGRTRDGDLREALGEHPFVLVVGDSKVGKTRTAFEVMRALFSDRALLIPAQPASVSQLPKVLAMTPSAVVWLDDLERYLGSDLLTDHVLDQLLLPGRTRVSVLATIRSSEMGRYAPRLGSEQQEVQDPAWKVIQRAHQVRLKRRLDAVEHHAAVAVLGDPKLIASVTAHGLAAYLAAGPDLVDRYHNRGEDQPVGPALVRVAVAWRRVGLHRPVPVRVLRELYFDFLHEQDQVPEHRRSEAWRQGLQWATERVSGANALLSTSAEGVMAFDYIIDQLGEIPIPDGFWSIALQAASGDPSESLRLGSVAYERGVFRVAERALSQVATSDSDLAPGAANNLALTLDALAHEADEESVRRSYWDRAEHAYIQAVDSGPPDIAVQAMVNLACLLADHGDRERSRETFQRAITAGDPDQTPRAWRLLGYRLSDWGDTLGAATAFRHAAATSHFEQAPKALIAIGDLLAGAGELQSAAALYRQVIDGDQQELATVGAMNLGMMLAENDPDAAKRAFAQAHELSLRYSELPWSKGGPLFNSVLHYGSAWAHGAYPKVIAAGHPRFVPMAWALLGCLLMEEGQPDEAREAFEQAMLDPVHAEARHIAAQGLLALSNPEQALPVRHPRDV
ncbi:tetratricopeptide repeat protein [Streptomyces sp. NPDC001156]